MTTLIPTMKFNHIEDDYDEKTRFLGSPLSANSKNSAVLKTLEDKWKLSVDRTLDSHDLSSHAYVTLANGDKAVIRILSSKEQWENELYFYQKLEEKYSDVFSPNPIDTDKESNVILLKKIEDEHPTPINSNNIEEVFFTWKAITRLPNPSTELPYIAELPQILENKVYDMRQFLVSNENTIGIDNIANRFRLLEWAFAKGVSLNEGSCVRTLLHGDIRPENVLSWRLVNPVTIYGDSFYDLASWVATSLNNDALVDGIEHVHELLVKLSKLYVKNIENNEDFTVSHLAHQRLFDWVCVITILELQDNPSFTKLFTIVEKELS